MRFDYDENKSQTNLQKHGIDFVDAQNLWRDPKGIVVPARTTGDEVRYALIARHEGKCHVAIFTLRDDIYRIISVRRCRKNEEKNYDNTSI
jgi:uncharacterized DUF497 family protein